MNPPKLLKKEPAPSEPNAIAVRRVLQDVMCTKSEKLDGIYIHADDGNLMIFHAIIEGPSETPYSGGFFYFYVKMPNDYPWSPPIVKLMTTGAGSVRFNPNLYSTGHVCLSILGTWRGPPWTPALNIMSVLLSIQSLLNKEPYFNEPGYTKGRPGMEKQSNEYSENIQYETLRVAVLGMIKNNFGETTALPKELKDKIRSRYVEQYDEYTDVIKRNIKPNETKYAALLKEFEQLKTNIDNENI